MTQRKRTFTRRPRWSHRLMSSAAAVGLLAGCSATGEPTATSAPPSAGPQTPSVEEHADTSPAESMPSDHVHGVAINPADDKVLLATHEGLFRYDADGPTSVGPAIDLMGFTVAGPDHFYASGHPGPGVDLPNPVGLIESTDGGETWTAVSRQGTTDFHTLSASTAGLVGFDGSALLRTPDGRTWADLKAPVPVYAVAASPDGTVLIATSQDGPALSADAGASWTVLSEAPLLQVVDFADARTAVGVTPQGGVYVSDDAGSTWTEHSAAGGSPQAVTADRSDDGALDVIVAKTDGMVRSQNGAPFAPLGVG